MMRCPVCRRTQHGPEAMLTHLTTHSHLVLAETCRPLSRLLVVSADHMGPVTT
jgi:hypothetical protein